MLLVVAGTAFAATLLNESLMKLVGRMNRPLGKPTVVPLGNG